MSSNGYQTGTVCVITGPFGRPGSRCIGNIVTVTGPPVAWAGSGPRQPITPPANTAYPDVQLHLWPVEFLRPLDGDTDERDAEIVANYNGKVTRHAPAPAKAA